MRLRRLPTLSLPNVACAVVACTVLTLTPLLAACTSTTPAPPLPFQPLATAPPLFASPDAALEAAAEANEKYLGVLDLVLGDGGDTAERLRSVAEGDALTQSTDAAREFHTRSLRQNGKSRVINVKLQRIDELMDVVAIYACLDLGDTSVSTSTGAPAAGANQRKRFAEQVIVHVTEEGLRVSSDTLWPGDDICPKS